MSGCLRCDGDGYLDESTLSVPVHCSCQVGVLARAMDSDPLDDRKAVLFDQARRAARSARRDG